MKKKEYQKRLAKEKRDLKEYRESNAGMNMKTFGLIAAGVIGFFLLMFVFTKQENGIYLLKKMQLIIQLKYKMLRFFVEVY